MKGKIRQVLTVALVLFAVVFAQAQVRTYSGVVVSSEDGQTMPGVSIKIAGTSRGTSADFDGNFSISAEKGQTLEFSFVGFQPVSVVLGDLRDLTITMDPDAAMLDDVVVVAYGTARKKDLTGSITTIEAGDIQDRQVSTVTRALEGQVPGIQVTSSSGQPGTDAVIRIRGIGSMNASNSALILVDGVPYPSTLSTLNPADIATVTVLKDAASTSLYGSRAANGIISITTKRGSKNQQANVSLNIRMGWNEDAIGHHNWISDPGDYYRMTWTAFAGFFYNNYGLDWQSAKAYAAENLISSQFGIGLGYSAFKLPAGASTLIDPATGKIVEGAQLLYQEDWYKELLGNRAFRQEYTASVTGGGENTSYYLSLGYLSDPSYAAGSKFERFSSRLNVDAQVNNWLNVGGNMSFTRRISDNPTNYSGGEMNTLNLFLFAKVIPSIYPIYARNADGSYMYDENGNRLLDMGNRQAGTVSESPIYQGPNPLVGGWNPLTYVEKDKFRTVLDNFAGSAYAEAKFLKDFTARATMSVETVYQNAKTFQNSEEGGAVSVGGALYQARQTSLTLNANQTINWAHNYGKHHLDALVGHEFYYSKVDMSDAYMLNMFIPGLVDLSNFIETGGLPTGYTGASAMESYFARVNYNWNEKYYVSASVRMDGTSTFRYDKWGTFWSAGASWRIAEENFIRDNVDWMDELKLRFSIGTTGNQAVNSTSYPYTDLWSLGESDGQFTLSQVWWGVPDLTWETNFNMDLGVDFRFWNRFYGSIDVYRRVTRDLLFEAKQPLSTGISTKMVNDGKLANQGLELELNYDIFQNPDIFWTVGLTASTYKQKILALPDYLMTAASGKGYVNGSYLWMIGKDQYQFYSGEGAGVDPETGKQLYWMDVVDDQGNVIGREKTDNPDEQTRYLQGSAIPDLMGGFNTTLRYAGFDLTVNTTFQIGGKIYDADWGNLYWQGSAPARNLGADLLDNTWTPDNKDAEFPMFSLAGSSYGDRAEYELVDASYFCLKNVTLGYTLPVGLTKKMGLSSVRVFASGENLWLTSARKGLDPRMGVTGGVVYIAYNQMRTFSFGANINF